MKGNGLLEWEDRVINKKRNKQSRNGEEKTKDIGEENRRTKMHGERGNLPDRKQQTA